MTLEVALAGTREARGWIAAWFDGCCEPVNPGGHASYGALVKVGGEVVLAESGYIGHGAAMSNNVAEYSGFLAVLRQLGELTGPAEIRGDSKLVIRQMLGQWRIHEGRGGLYVPYALKAQSLLAPLQSRVSSGSPVRRTARPINSRSVHSGNGASSFACSARVAGSRTLQLQGEGVPNEEPRGCGAQH